MDAVLGWNLVLSLPVILAIAWLAGRLLGVSRSWAATLVAGMAGWLAALALSLAIAAGDTGAPGFTRNLWVFAAVFTMSASVWVELLAKPGALARAQRGLVSIPRPLRAIRRSSRRLSRYAQITGIAVRYGFGPLLGLGQPVADDVAAPPAAPAARRLRQALEECGGMFVKLGQVLSTRADLLPHGVVAELSRLQDQVAPAAPESVMALLEAELGRPVGEVFAELDAEPLAAASIAQAYRGRLRSGEAVVVKVQRPGIAESVDRDLLVLAELARVAEARTAWGADYHVTELAGEFADRLREELDFRLEARNATEIAALTAADQVHVPAVHTELSTARILVMEWLDGVSVREVERIDALGLDRSRLAETLLRSSLRQMLVDGRFHADPHPGNVLVLEDGRLGLIDFGATGRLDPLQQASMREMLVAVQQQDAGLLRSAVLEVATLRRHFDDDQLERALARFMSRHLAAGAAPSAAMFNELLQRSSRSGSTSRPSSRPSSAPWSPWKGPSPPCRRATWSSRPPPRSPPSGPGPAWPRPRSRSWPAGSSAASPSCCAGPPASWTASPPSSSAATSRPGCGCSPTPRTCAPSPGCSTGWSWPASGAWSACCRSCSSAPRAARRSPATPRCSSSSATSACSAPPC